LNGRTCCLKQIQKRISRDDATTRRFFEGDFRCAVASSREAGFPLFGFRMGNARTKGFAKERGESF
jgi:hypothetical protein